MDPERDRSPTCPWCNRTFASYRGRRVHERQAHAAAFHQAESELLQRARKKPRWDREELALMAQFEAQHPDERHMNMAIRERVLPERSLEAVKGARRDQAYKNLVLSISRSLATPQHHPDRLSTPPPPQPPALARPRTPPLPPRAALSPPGTPAPGPATNPPQTDHTNHNRELVKRVLEQLSEEKGLPFPQNITEVENQVKEWLPPKIYAYKPPPARPPVQHVNRSKERRAQFREIQRMWKRDRGKAAKGILSGVAAVSAVVPPGTKEFWSTLFSRPSPPEARSPIPLRDTLTVDGPVQASEVEQAINNTKATTSPGPDGITLQDIKLLDKDLLCWAFNAILYYGQVPPTWASGKTILLPKVPEPNLPGEFRPITITSLLLRLYNKILSRRLMDEAPLPIQQKGFAPEEGVAANILLLNEIIKEAKCDRRSVYVAFIDFKKAFDSIGHPSLLAAAKRWGLPPAFVQYLESLYQQATTNIMGNTIKITRGVLQGDPLSPYLFNICLDWVLSSLPSGVGARLRTQKINYIAYADDVALTASTATGLQKGLDMLTEGAGAVGLELGHAKCATLSIVGDKKKKRWLVEQSRYFTAGGERLKALQAGQTYKYLGLEIGPSRHREPAKALAALIKDLGLIQKAPLKPQQKLWVAKFVIIPKHCYQRVLGKSTSGLLERYDLEMRRFLKKALHLPGDTPIAAFYTKVRDGGLGVFSFSSGTPILKQGLLERLGASTDQRVANIAADLLNPQATPSKTARDQESKRHRNRLYGSIDGRGLAEAPGTAPIHEWVDDGTQLMRGHVYISALKTRMNLVHSRLRASRGRPAAPTQCDLGCGRPESLGHILQTCPALAPERTARHNHVLQLLERLLIKKGWSTHREPSIRTVAGLRKPDLVVWDSVQSAVIDVQVVADSSAGPTLENAHDLKIRYYDNEDIKRWVLEKTGHPPIVSALTINWRGLINNRSYMTLKSLKLSKSDIKVLVVRSLEGSVAITRAHRDIGGTGRA